jgi:hypothetical protein
VEWYAGRPRDAWVGTIPGHEIPRRKPQAPSEAGVGSTKPVQKETKMTSRLIEDLSAQVVRAAMANRAITPRTIQDATYYLAELNRKCDPRSEMERIAAEVRA